MSLQQFDHSTVDRSCRTPGAPEMQREDFLALATALRRFNDCQSPVSIVVANAQYGGDRYATLAIE
jgi:hypothetical protein